MTAAEAGQMDPANQINETTTLMIVFIFKILGHFPNLSEMILP
jgi:hypothetical protein